MTSDYKARQKLKAVRSLLASSADARAYEKQHGISVLAVAKIVNEQTDAYVRKMLARPAPK